MAESGGAVATAGAMAAAGGELFTRGGPNMPDTRGQSMVAKHIERQQKEKEHKALEKLKLLMPQLGPAVRAMALQECDWNEEKAVVMLRRFQVGRLEELRKLQKERKKHQLGLDRNKKDGGDKKSDKGKRREGSKASGGSESSSGSSSESESGSESGGSSGSGSESESEGERRRRRQSGGKRKRSRSRSPKRSSKRRREKERSNKRRKEKKRKDKEKDRKRSKKDKRGKAKVKAKVKAKAGPIGQEYGKYGIIRETDMYTKRPEFQLWAMEVKGVDLEAMPRLEEKEMFKDYMEEYNTATLPNRKYYDLELYERQRAAKAARKGMEAVTAGGLGGERIAFDDEAERRRELAAERARQQQERMKQAYEELQTTDKARNMREQELLRAQMQLAYRTGDTRKAEQIRARLEPDDPLNPKAQGVRAPATGT